MLRTFSFRSLQFLPKIKPVFVYLGQSRFFSLQPKEIPVENYIERSSWTDEDTDKLMKLAQVHGTRWVVLHKYFPERGISSIRCRYRVVKLGSTSWTESEKRTIQELVKDNENIDWQRVKQSLPNKNLSSIRYYVKAMQIPVRKGKWTKKETEQLMDLVKKHGENWESISKEIGTRTADQCKIRHEHETNYVPGKFSKEEDQALIEAVKKHGKKSFLKIKNEMNSERAPRQLKDRYVRALDPEVDRSPWTKEEENQMYSLYRELKSAKLVIKEMNSKRDTRQIYNRLRKFIKKNPK